VEKRNSRLEKGKMMRQFQERIDAEGSFPK